MLSWEDGVKKGQGKTLSVSTQFLYFHHLVQIRQFHGLTNGLVVLDHLIKQGRERSSPNLEQVSPRQRVVGVAVAKTMDKRYVYPSEWDSNEHGQRKGMNLLQLKNYPPTLQPGKMSDQCFDSI
ncbi:hypothetical protein SERLA73DRAFT_187991 [Serpula lacrymans var. lacrymans S7.3]|uniref:Uncharacterized protein n=1 Tax=Serpula lacrymans var. lacrymans (strain S7.3) TaxID=936435 RepID=F8Q9Y8_SERL3|nr:hypothetical protein SERLA73DRAFT_187991 [Serpula lacrymans var. lacrymans S7.3]